MASSDLVRGSSPPPRAALAGELVDDAGLAALAAEVAARQRSPETRRTYAAVYRAFAAFLGPNATPADLTPQTVRGYRDALEAAGRSPSTVATHHRRCDHRHARHRGCPCARPGGF